MRVRAKIAGALSLAVAASGLLVLTDTSVPMASATANVPANTLAKKPQMGWNSWNVFKCNIDENKIKAAADAMVSSGMKAAGYEYVNIDDCWAEQFRDANGNLVPHKGRFPGGIKAIADYVHAKGLKLGIYSSAGRHTCTASPEGFWQPGSIGFEQQDANLWASWGVDYVKYDNCGDRLGQSNEQRYTAMGKAIRNTGRDMLYAVCNWGEDEPWEFVPRVGGNSWRNTLDISDNWGVVMALLDLQKGLEPFAKPGAWNDPDMLEVGNGRQTATEYRSHFSLWAMLNAPLITGNNLATMTPEIRGILTNPDIIAVNQDWGGSQGRLLRDLGNGLEVWGKPNSDGSVAVALFNRGTATATITTSAAEIGLGGSSSYRLRDLWSKAESTTAGTISASVPSHGTVVYRVWRQGTLAAAPAAGTHQVSAMSWLASSNGWGPVERDKSNGQSAAGDGGSLRIGTTTYATGLGAHADSAVHVYLGKACARFEAKVGVDAVGGGTAGTVRFQVYGDGQLLAYTDVLRAGAPAVPLSVPTKGFHTLELRATDARDGKNYDHADWADARVTCFGGSNGSNVSDRQWTSSTNAWGPVERDMSNGENPLRDGTVLTLAGARYTKGLGVHAASSVVVPLAGRCHGFDATVGLDAEVGTNGSVTFEVLADGVSVHTSPVLRGGQTANVAIGLNRPAALTLKVNATADGNAYDHADWAGARLSCD
ncbi:alpha-galactosidase [Actinokineospora alba]|uniref:Alpha-galactosidase n=1 Tax=Actinokineospora alba TaxID=504798 RepID=A0A1H0NNB8_9PSEU|nr:NPCBM/NEW2 domain-containing protein [Actinokineospora alba]TDP68771.1 alpha-galactosidase [Actinokineospora alba]SDH86323.1 alpha-galactosidase [Actinokineospora alba]SDO93830.1 alpha-galactosidase [Actinokineospora alba]